jgi:NADH-quinone oxidoreductase subunit G
MIQGNCPQTTDIRMPTLVIDDREIEVPPGTKVIQAAEKLGIMIPRFCYHPALGYVGACRVCAVKFLQGPFKGVQMSCMIDVQDGMIVSTTDEEAVDFRKHVIEWLMLHHPHDCPVCDEGGHCLLQDMTVAGGHGIRRYLGPKRTYRDQYLGPLVQHEMNRCIHCYRCSRFYQEYSGYRDLGVLRIGNRTYFGRYKDGPLESPFAGNLTDICPTGVYTDKPSRFIGRRWDFERGPSLCINCSLGCHTVASTRYRQVVCQEARFSEIVNGYFICDRGRYGFAYTSQPERPRHARIGSEEVSWEDTLQTVAKRLNQISRQAGSDAIACMGSTRSSLETQGMLKRLCQENGWRDPVFWMEHDMALKVKRAVSNQLSESSVSLREVEQADFILTVGADPLNEAPMLAMAMRQAHRNGARIAVLDPRPIELPFEYLHEPVSPEALNLWVGRLIKSGIDREITTALGEEASEFYNAIPKVDLLHLEHLSDIVADLRVSQRPVIVCGMDTVTPTTPDLAADWVALFKAAGKQAGIFYTLPGANAFGAALFSEDGQSFDQLLTQIEKGDVKALVIIETDPFWHFSDRKRLDAAFAKLDFIVVLDYINSQAVQLAHIFLPTATVYETDGVFVNQEGRAQLARHVLQGGIPVAQVGGGDHPPRQYDTGIPGKDSRPAWLTLAAFAYGESQIDEEMMRANLWNWLAEISPGLADIPSHEKLTDEGIRLIVSGNRNSRFSLDWSAELENYLAAAEGYKLLTVDWTFGTEELSAHSPVLQKVERTPCLFMHRRDAAKLDLTDGDTVVIKVDTGTLEVTLCLAENMAGSLVVLPRHRQLAWQIVGTGKICLQEGQILKAE